MRLVVRFAAGARSLHLLARFFIHALKAPELAGCRFAVWWRGAVGIEGALGVRGSAGGVDFSPGELFTFSAVPIFYSIPRRSMEIFFEPRQSPGLFVALVFGLDEHVAFPGVHHQFGGYAQRL